MNITPNDIRNILRTALDEDLEIAGDITSQAIFGAADAGAATINSKQNGVLSGVYLIEPLFEMVDSYLSSPIPAKVDIFCADGDMLEPGKTICRISGTLRTILAGERVILNLLQKLSGVATMTALMVNTLKNTNARLLDTRKTTPGLRVFEKAAVDHGGGVNHRFGLYDMILIKDTHVKRAGGIKAALEKAIAWRGNKGNPQIEIEVQSAEEFIEAMALGPDRIMLDNMSPQEIKICVGARDSSGLKIELEASGNITPASLSAIAAAGADFISSGAITHSAPALDINLTME